MMRCAIIALLLLTGCSQWSGRPSARPAATPPPDASRKAESAPLHDDTMHLDGFIPLRWDAENGKLLMEITRFGEEMIWQVSLAAGLGSNQIGLDRHQLGSTHVIRFERVGPRVLMVEPNYAYRATSSDPAERRAVEESFAQSVLAGFKIESTTPNGVLVDATDFFLSDPHGVARRLRDAQQGTYSLDKSRSAIYMPRTKAFPRNTEVEATLTFTTSDRPGAQVREVTPSADAITLREHYSFVASPPPGFTPRRADPRVGIFGVEFYDYSSPFTGPITTRWIARHRLAPGESLVYYVDNGVPEPIRGALVEGASWWNQAFEAAGFPHGFQVKVLPPDADPLDIRYNVINWVHRSTRGWSYGGAVIDPRTGEIIKGNVLLGSLRIRQDVLLARGLMSVYDDLDPKTSPSLMALARIRQLAVHEVGHTLGLDHNMAASTYGRASVMDYPSPNIKIIPCARPWDPALGEPPASARPKTDQCLDLSDAYATGVGAYDIAAIKYAYQPVKSDAELEALAAATPLFVSDPHSRPASGAHPLGSVWDSGADPVAALRHEIEVRRIALEQFGARNIDARQPLADLEVTLVPLFLHHRYQLEAAVKSIGGVFFTYDRTPPKVVPAQQQRDALAAALETLQPSFLTIPQRIVELIPPPAYNSGNANTELFPRRTDPTFDPIAAATTSADITVSALLDPARCARLVQQNEFTMRDVTSALIDLAAREGRITRATRTLIFVRLAELAANRDADPQVRAEASDALRRLSARLTPVADTAENAHRTMTRDDIKRFLERPAEAWQPPHLPEIPPGPPI
jgi:hypothetical protein